MKTSAVREMPRADDSWTSGPQAPFLSTANLLLHKIKLVEREFPRRYNLTDNVEREG